MSSCQVWRQEWNRKWLINRERKKILTSVFFIRHNFMSTFKLAEKIRGQFSSSPLSYIYFHQKRLINMLPMSHQPLSGDHFKVKYVRKCVLGPKCPNMVIRPQTLQKLEILMFFNFIRSNSPISFQRAINHYLEIILRHNIPQNVFWAQNAQIWLFGPSPPKIENLDFLIFTRSDSPIHFPQTLNHYLQNLF